MKVAFKTLFNYSLGPEWQCNIELGTSHYDDVYHMLEIKSSWYFQNDYEWSARYHSKRWCYDCNATASTIFQRTRSNISIQLLQSKCVFDALNEAKNVSLFHNQNVVLLSVKSTIQGIGLSHMAIYHCINFWVESYRDQDVAQLLKNQW